jgi:hypothetical protein
MNTKTEDALAEINEVLRVLKGQIERALDRERTTCVNCIHFDSQHGVCNANNRLRPPAHIIAYGCPRHDTIPF